MEKLFVWNNEEHAQHFPKLLENKALKDAEEERNKDTAAQIEQIKNDLNYGVSDE